MGNNGNVCSEVCGWCGACSGGTPANAVCRACGHDYVRDGESIGYACERCVANAHARAEVTVESRQKPQVKPVKPPARCGVTPEEVVR